MFGFGMVSLFPGATTTRFTDQICFSQGLIFVPPLPILSQWFSNKRALALVRLVVFQEVRVVDSLALKGARASRGWSRLFGVFNNDPSGDPKSVSAGCLYYQRYYLLRRSRSRNYSLQRCHTSPLSCKLELAKTEISAQARTTGAKARFEPIQYRLLWHKGFVGIWIWGVLSSELPRLTSAPDFHADGLLSQCWAILSRYSH
jgi:hypothetical protein